MTEGIRPHSENLDERRGGEMLAPMPVKRGDGKQPLPSESDRRPSAHLLDPRHAFRIAVFIALYVGSATSAYLLAGITPHSNLGWIVAAAPFYVLAAASLHGISLFTHEAVHGTLSANRCLNAVLGALCALPVLQNYSAYRILHLQHHDHLGAEGDPDHYPNYTRWSWMVFLMNWGRLLIGYPVYILAIPILAFRQAHFRQRIQIGSEVLGTVGVIVCLFLLPWPMVIHTWLLPMLIINTFVNIRGMSQHTLLEQYHGDAIRGTRTILTNRVTTFFMCNENYHLEHHLHPGVPWYHLPRLHQQLRADLITRGANFIPSYFSFVREFVVGSFRRSPLGRNSGESLNQ